MKTDYGFILSLQCFLFLLLPLTHFRERVHFLVKTKRRQFFVLFWISITTCLGQLYAYWAFNIGNHAMTLGKLPWNDASDYLYGALRLVEGANGLDAWSCRRPLNHFFWGSVLGIFQQNLNAVFIFLSFLFSGVFAVVSVALLQVTNWLVTLCFLFFNLFFFRTIALGVLLSEPIGFYFGFAFLGFMLFWCIAPKSRYLFFAFLCLTIGLTVRAGSFFTVPVLLLGLLYFCCHTKVSFKKTFATSLAGICFGLGLNFFQFKMNCGSASEFNSNLSYTIYGLASGGESWTFVYEEVPEIKKLLGKERSDKVYQLAFKKIRRDPIMLLIGLKKSVFNYLEFSMYIFGKTYKFIEMLLYIFGFILLWRGRKFYFDSSLGRLQYISFLLFVGSLLSSSIISKDGGLRVFAATLPGTLLVPAFGFGFIFSLSAPLIVKSKERSSQVFIPLLALCLPIIVFLLFGRSIAKTGKTPYDLQSAKGFECQEGDVKAQMRANHSLSLGVSKYVKHILTDGVVSWRHLFGNTPEIVKGNAKKFFPDRENMTLITGYDLINKRLYRLQVEGLFGKKRSEVENFCVEKGSGYYLKAKKMNGSF